jgi:cell division inhibitor SepF
MARSFGKFFEWFLGDKPEDDYAEEEVRYEQRPYSSQASSAPPPVDHDPVDDEQQTSRGGFWRSRMSREADVVEMRPSQPTTSVLYPRSFDDAQGLADQFKRGTFLILDLEKVEEKDRARLVHFLCGVAYGCDGKSHRINELTFAFAPRSHALDTESSTADARHATETRGQFELPRFSLPG